MRILKLFIARRGATVYSRCRTGRPPRRSPPCYQCFSQVLHVLAPLFFRLKKYCTTKTKTHFHRVAKWAPVRVYVHRVAKNASPCPCGECVPCARRFLKRIYCIHLPHAAALATGWICWWQMQGDEGGREARRRHYRCQVRKRGSGYLLCRGSKRLIKGAIEVVQNGGE